jgi:hypothetical protein
MARRERLIKTGELDEKGRGAILAAHERAPQLVSPTCVVGSGRSAPTLS